MNRISKKLQAGVLATAVAALVGGQAFTASNTVGASKAGSGSTAISGYTISAIDYTANATTPTDLDSVKFDVGAAANEVKARVSATGSWYSCVNTAATTLWTCATTTPQTTVAAADNLTVVATQ